ncbi:hypothetical protein ml_180 [Mollivirus sibericum]|uniref:hypothetical protein n=1 Tax=Mollivirus sibericum TaxID=1678078 RepID=UPI0006B2DD51|nr:hypothetical protein ml_180 [Mollivirus sibericum]ALD61982.1 hypothetical protein ml_180 [Mollivirus sibericum]
MHNFVNNDVLPPLSQDRMLLTEACAHPSIHGAKTPKSLWNPVTRTLAFDGPKDRERITNQAQTPRFWHFARAHGPISSQHR